MQVERRVEQIPGWNGRALQTVRYVVEGAHQLAVVFPGRGYTCDMPALYYTRAVLLAAGIEVFEVHYRYEEVFVGEVTADSLAELKRRLEADVQAAVPVALEGGSYESATLVGKSMGTRAIVHVLGEELLGSMPARVILHTPLLGDEESFEALRTWEGPALHVIGTADPHYDEARVAALAARDGVLVRVVEGANHGLEIEGDPGASAGAMRDVTLAVERFVKQK